MAGRWMAFQKVFWYDMQLTGIRTELCVLLSIATVLGAGSCLLAQRWSEVERDGCQVVWRGEGILAFTLAMTLITAGCRATKPPITQHAAQTALHSRAHCSDSGWYEPAELRITSRTNARGCSSNTNHCPNHCTTTVNRCCEPAVSEPVTEPISKIVDASTNPVVPAAAVSVPPLVLSEPAQLASNEASTTAVNQASLAGPPLAKVEQQPTNGRDVNGRDVNGRDVKSRMIAFRMSNYALKMCDRAWLP